MGVTVAVLLLITVLMGMVMVVLVRVTMLVGMGVARLACGGEHVDLGAGDAAADDFAGFKAGADAEGGDDFREFFQGYAGIHQRAEKHIPADAGEAFQITDTHRFDCGIRGREEESSGRVQLNPG